MRKSLILLLRGYRYLISPWVGSHCRFYPSCSEYAIDAIAGHGAWKGMWLTCRRLARCHPWHDGGHDPVPLAFQAKQDDVQGCTSVPHRDVPTPRAQGRAGAASEAQKGAPHKA